MFSLRLVSELRVRSCDVDSFGHVNNAVYLQYCEGARNDYMLQRGLRFTDFQEWNSGPVLIAARLEYKHPARTDDPLQIHGEIHRQGRMRFEIRHEMVHAENQKVICLAWLDFVFVRLDTGRPCRIPEPFEQAFHLLPES